MVQLNTLNCWHRISSYNKVRPTIDSVYISLHFKTFCFEKDQFGIYSFNILLRVDKCSYKMTGFEPWMSCAGSDRSVDCVHFPSYIFGLMIKWQRVKQMEAVVAMKWFGGLITYVDLKCFWNRCMGLKAASGRSVKWTFVNNLVWFLFFQITENLNLRFVHFLL